MATDKEILAGAEAVKKAYADRLDLAAKLNMNVAMLDLAEKKANQTRLEELKQQQAAIEALMK